jgi:hypothetical protein
MIELVLTAQSELLSPAQATCWTSSIEQTAGQLILRRDSIVLEQNQRVVPSARRWLAGTSRHFVESYGKLLLIPGAECLPAHWELTIE